jgi:hypothetical protein
MALSSIGKFMFPVARSNVPFLTVGDFQQLRRSSLANFTSLRLYGGKSPHMRALAITPTLSRMKSVASFKNPSFQDRQASAQKAKQKAIDQLKARPPVDEGEMAKRRQAWEVQQQALSDERVAKAQANAAAKVEEASVKAAIQAEAEKAAALKAARLKPASAEDMKAARDARYAARKARK